MTGGKYRRIHIIVAFAILALIFAIGPVAREGLANISAMTSGLFGNQSSAASQGDVISSAGSPADAPIGSSGTTPKGNTPPRQYPGAAQVGPNQWRLPNGNIYGYSLRNDTSPPLRDIPPV